MDAEVTLIGFQLEGVSSVTCAVKAAQQKQM